MSDTEYKRIFQLARERATAGFAALLRRAMTEADESLAQELETGTAPDRSVLLSARQVLTRDADALQKRGDELFRSYLERAMRTMYTDLRPDLMKRSADELTLIDDETVNRQIEVDRLVLRIRNEDEKIIGRLNVIVARMHGDHDARERENPFRPYLLARSLHEAVKRVVADEAVARTLFEHLSNALVRNFSAYYADIVETFESRGIRAQFAPRLSKPVWNQRYFGALTALPEPLPAEFTARLLPGMLRVLELVRHAPQMHDLRAADGADGSAALLQEFMRDVFAPAYAAGPEGRARGVFNLLAPASRESIAQLTACQVLAARGEPFADGIEPDRNQLFALRDRLASGKAAGIDAAIIDVVAMLFEFVLEDDKIPPPLRGELGRLQIPLLKAAMLEPELLRNPEHPARRLLNRLCSVAVGCDPGTTDGAVIAEAIAAAAAKVLKEFDADTGIFSTALAEFERFLAGRLCHADVRIAACAAALEHAERSSLLLAVAAARLADLLAPLQADARVAEFITGAWAGVLAKAFLQAPEGESADYARYLGLLPHLVWSVQEKQDGQQRDALMRLLPGLVKRLRAGLAFIGLSEAQSRQALDQLVELHTQAMRPGQATPSRERHDIEALRQRFARLKLDRVETAPADDAWEVSSSAIHAALAEGNAAAVVRADQETAPPGGEELRALFELPLGACMAYRAGDGADGAELRLTWVSPRRRLYLFKPSSDADPIVYAAAALLREIRDGALRPLEYAPIFERAAASLMMGAGAVDSGLAAQ